MFASPRVLLALALCAGFLTVPPARAEDNKGEPVKKPQPAAEPAKPIVIQIDASKLPPDVLKQLLQLAEKSKPGAEVTKPADKPKPTAEPVKPGAKPAAPDKPKPAAKAISLSDAIAIVEKGGKVTVVKAEREDEDGQARFELEATDGKGGKLKLTLDAGGNVIKKSVKGDDKEGEEKKGEKNEKGRK